MTPADLATWVLSYAVHSTVLLGGAWLLTRSGRLARPAAADVVWKAALVGGLVTATVHQVYAPAAAVWGGSVALAADRADGLAAGGGGGRRGAAGDRGVAAAGVGFAAGDGGAAGAAAAKGDRQAAAAVGGERGAAVAAPVYSGGDAVGAAGSTDGAGSAGAVGSVGSAVLGFGASVVPYAIGAWLVLALVALARLGLAHLRLSRWLAPRQAVEDPALLGTADDIAETAGLGGVRLTWLPDLYSPVALGTREVCLPSAAFEELDSGQIRSVLAHEIAHLARRDPLWLAFSVVLERVFFFQPLNRLARVRMQDAAEFLCDEWAARESGSGITLATSLARVAEWMEPACPHPVPLTGIAESRSQLVRRVHRLMEPDVAAPATGVWRARLAAAGFVAATALAVPGIGLAEREAAAGAAGGDAAMPSAQRGSGRGSGSGAGIGVGVGFGVGQGADPRATPAPAADVAASPEAMADLIDAASAIEIEFDDLQLRSGQTTVELRNLKLGTAARPMSDTTRARIVQALIAALRDSDAEVRLAAAEALGDLEDRRAVPGLVAALRDGSSEVRHAAVHALGHLEDTAAVMPMIGLLGDANAETRAEAAHTLGQLEDTRATQPLLPLLRDASVEVRRAAAEALGDLEDPRAADALAAALGDADAEVRQEAADALGRLELATAPTPLLAAMRDPVRDVQLSAIESVGDIRDARAVSVLRELLETDDADVQEHVVEALGEIRTEAALEALADALRSTNPNVRRHAASALGGD